MNAGLQSKPIGRAFTLIELLVVVAVTGVLMSLLLPALSRAQSRSQQISCVNRLRQWTVALTMYAAENEDRLPRESFIPGGTVLNLWAQVRHPLASDVWYNALPRLVDQPEASDFAPSAVRTDFYRRERMMQCPSARFSPGAAKDPVAYFSVAMNSKLVRPSSPGIVLLGSVVKPSATVAFLDNRLPDEPKVHPGQIDQDLGQPSAYASRFVTRHQQRGTLSFLDGHVETKTGPEVVEGGYALLPQTSVIWTADPKSDPNLTY